MSLFAFGMFVLCGSIIGAQCLFVFKVRPVLKKHGVKVRSHRHNLAIFDDLENYIACDGSPKVYKAIHLLLNGTYLGLFLVFIGVVKGCQADNAAMQEIMKEEGKARYERIFDE